MDETAAAILVPKGVQFQGTPASVYNHMGHRRGLGLTTYIGVKVGGLVGFLM